MAVRAYVEVAHGLDPVAWPGRHARGEVPNRLPFGVDQLADHDVEVLVRPLLHSRRARRLAQVLDARTGQLEWVEAVRDLARRDRHDADVVLSWDEWNGVPSGLLRPLRRTPPVVTGVMNLTDWQGLTPRFARVARAGLARAAAVWVHVPVMVDKLVSEWGVDRSRIHVVPFGVDADYFTPLGTAPDRDLVASVGDDGYRDHALLVRAVAAIRETRPATRLQLATILPVEVPPEVGTVHRGKLGPRRRAFYGGAAVVAVATRWNIHGSGLSVCLEAMACGRPFVGVDSPGYAGYLTSGEGGLLVPAGDTGAFAAAVRELLEDPDRADALGRAGRRLVEERLNTREQARHLAALLHAAA